jgi:hypothetical protein
MNHSQSSENLYEADQTQRQQGSANYAQPTYINPAQSGYPVQPGYPMQQPGAQVVYVEQQSPDGFIAPLLIASAISICLTPVGGLLALLCFRGKRGIAGSLIGTGIGFLLYGILILVLAVPYNNSCVDFCVGTTNTSTNVSTSDSSTDCGCSKSKSYFNIIGGGKFHHHIENKC